MPSLNDKTVDYMRDCNDWMSNKLVKAPDPYTILINYINEYLKGRVLATTTEGHPVLASRKTQAGDQICIILGYILLLILRPNFDSLAHQIFGECYLDSIINGEALLGKLPKGCAQIWKEFPEITGDYMAFVNSNQGKVRLKMYDLGRCR